MNYSKNTQHTQMETNVLQRKFSHIKEKRIVTFESLVPRCWYPIVTKFLLILDQNFLAYKQQLYLLFFFSYFFHLLSTPNHIDHHYLFKLLETNFPLTISLAFTQKDRPSICTFKSDIFLFFFPLSLFYFYPIGLNIGFHTLNPIHL
jgi:hypothetical protein